MGEITSSTLILEGPEKPSSLPAYTRAGSGVTEGGFSNGDSQPTSLEFAAVSWVLRDSAFVILAPAILDGTQEWGMYQKTYLQIPGSDRTPLQPPHPHLQVFCFVLFFQGGGGGWGGNGCR